MRNAEKDPRPISFSSAEKSAKDSTDDSDGKREKCKSSKANCWLLNVCGSSETSERQALTNQEGLVSSLQCKPAAVFLQECLRRLVPPVRPLPVPSLDFPFMPQQLPPVPGSTRPLSVFQRQRRQNLMVKRHWRADSPTERAVGPSGTFCAPGHHGSRQGLWRETSLSSSPVRKQTLGLCARTKDKVPSMGNRGDLELDLATFGIHETAPVVVPRVFCETFQHWAPRSFELNHAPHVDIHSALAMRCVIDKLNLTRHHPIHAQNFTIKSHSAAQVPRFLQPDLFFFW